MFKFEYFLLETHSSRIGFQIQKKMTSIFTWVIPQKSISELVITEREDQNDGWTYSVLFDIDSVLLDKFLQKLFYDFPGNLHSHFWECIGFEPLLQHDSCYFCYEISVIFSGFLLSNEKSGYTENIYTIIFSCTYYCCHISLLKYTGSIWTTLYMPEALVALRFFAFYMGKSGKLIVETTRKCHHKDLLFFNNMQYS